MPVVWIREIRTVTLLMRAEVLGLFSCWRVLLGSWTVSAR